MRKFAIALLFPFAVHAADKVFSDGPIAVIFHTTPCTVPQTQASIAAHGPTTEAQAATVVIQGRRSAGCWALDEDGDYIVVDERGSGGVIFAKAVKEPRGSI
jgi:hypothetical protein